MELSENAENFFLSWGITPTEISDIKRIAEKKKPEPNKDVIVAIFNKFVEKVNQVTLQDGMWILKSPDGPKTPATGAGAVPGGSKPENESGTSIAVVNPEEESTDALDDTQNDGTQKKDVDPKTPQGQKECIHLRAGHCKHGRMGRTKDEEGKTCSYFHPKRACPSYTKAGKCQSKECKNMHPFLCRAWKSGRDCWTQDCKRLHPQEPAEKKMDRQQRTNIGPRFARNFNNRPQPQQRQRGQYPEDRSQQQQPQADQALFLDIEKRILGQVSNMIAQMMKNHQQNQNLQQHYSPPTMQQYQPQFQPQVQTQQQQQFNLPRGQGPEQWVGS